MDNRYNVMGKMSKVMKEGQDAMKELASSKSKLQMQSTKISKQTFQIEAMKSAKEFDNSEIKRLKKQLDNQNEATRE